jgi:hypothetical protein
MHHSSEPLAWDRWATPQPGTEQVYAFLSCGFDPALGAVLTLGFSNKRIIDHDPTLECVLNWTINMQPNTDLKNCLQSYAYSYANSSLLLLLTRDDSLGNTNPTFPSFRNAFLQALDSETSRNSLSMIELIIGEPDFIEYFKDFLLQLSWMYNQTVEVPGRILLAWADQVNKVSLSAEYANQARIPGVDIFKAVHDAGVAELGKVVERRFCPGCAMEFLDPLALIEHFDSSLDCKVDCSCGQVIDNSMTWAAKHDNNDHLIPCKSCEEYNNWPLFQRHMSLSRVCQSRVRGKSQLERSLEARLRNSQYTSGF